VVIWQVLVGSGRHEWPGARIVVGGWRADPEFPHRGVLPSDDDAMPKKDGVAELRLRGEVGGGARLWGMWFMEPESRGELERVTCATNDTEPCHATIQVRACECRNAPPLTLFLPHQPNTLPRPVTPHTHISNPERAPAVCHSCCVCLRVPGVSERGSRYSCESAGVRMRVGARGCSYVDT
jgi:hypothetical protein